MEARCCEGRGNGVKGWGVTITMMICGLQLAGCGDDEPVAPPDPPRATAISISPSSATLTSIEETATFTAAITDQYGAAFSGTVGWSSDAPDVFTVDSNGTVTSVWNGTGMVRAAYETLNATASVTVDAGQPPEPRSEFPDFALSAGGGSMGVALAAFFQDPDNDAVDLAFTARLSNADVATADVVVDSEGHAAVILTGTAVGATELTIAATDPAGLFAEQSAVLTVDGEGATPFPIIRVSDNTVFMAQATIVGGCSPPLRNLTNQEGFIVTINSSIWHSRSDSAAAWAHIEGTERTDGRVCSHTTTVAGEYRLVFNMTVQVDEHHAPFTGDYRSGNTFTVVDTVSGNRPPRLHPAHERELTLGSRGGPLPFVATRYFTDPDGDTLTFALANSDSASLSAELTVDPAGHSMVILRGRSEGMSKVTVTATDPAGLSTDWNIDVTVEDSGYTPLTFFSVANGAIVVLGSQVAVCLPPIVNLTTPSGNVITVHASKWQRRSDSTAEWSDIAGTEKTNGQVCPYSATDPGDYRLVYEMSILFDLDVAPTRGWYRSPSFFTVSSGGD